MADQPHIDEPLPEALLDERRRVSLVWLIPLVALVSAIWLGYRAYEQQGPLVSISFRTAEGLEAGKTRVRFKDVDVGVVEAIELTPDLGKVQVRVRLAANVGHFLNDQARFWVVRPRLSGGRVSGLETLLGGTYIGADFALDGVERRVFEGLETPPIVTATQPGKVFTLHAASLGSLSEGSPVRFRGIEVGRVVGYALREQGGLDVQVFVDAPHDAQVGVNTRFWNVSGVGLTLDASGIRLNSDSLASILLGGIAFGTPDGTGPGEPAVEGAGFQLFASEDLAMERRFLQREMWQLAFTGSVRGLLPGAPVELRGIRIGDVRDVQLRLDMNDLETQIPVTIAIEPGRLGIAPAVGAQDGAQSANRALWDRLVANGLRAQIKTANLLTGALYVDLDFYPDDAPREIVWDEGLPRLPTVPTALDELRGLLTRLARLPLDRMGDDLGKSLAALHQTMESTNALLQRLDRETVSELSKTLEQTRVTLVGLEKVLAPNSPLQAEASRVLRELGAAARSFRIMADYLERHPEALIRGKGANGQ
ncbi:MAG: MlaD family protein [Chromatiaceae bacterium]|jgi:paraquat-inducible protein B|nr:MlaD family protein [Chromatiaceae bacterium]